MNSRGGVTDNDVAKWGRAEAGDFVESVWGRPTFFTPRESELASILLSSRSFRE
jgi:hypothetical protein